MTPKKVGRLMKFISFVENVAPSCTFSNSRDVSGSECSTEGVSRTSCDVLSSSTLSSKIAKAVVLCYSAESEPSVPSSDSSDDDVRCVSRRSSDCETGDVAEAAGVYVDEL